MNPFNNTPDIILDLIFLQLNEEDLRETLRVSKSWFWASIRRIKKLKISWKYNPLKTIAEFYNNHRPANEDDMDWCDLFRHLVLDELVVDGDNATTNYLVNNGCNTAKLAIKAPRKATPISFASLKNLARLQCFEYRNNLDMEWHPFIIECLKSLECEFDPNKESPIEAIKLNSSAWNTEDSVLHSVTKLSVSHATIDFLRTMVDHCPNLEELHCTYGTITEEWHHVFPSNVKRIEFYYFTIYSDFATIVDASTDSGRHLLPYICQKWESVEKFHFDGHIHLFSPIGNILLIGRIVYQAFPQQREEVFDCAFVNDDMNFASPLFQSREIHVRCSGRKALELTIPPTKCAKFFCHVDRNFKFSPRAVCLEPGKVEHLTISLTCDKAFTPEPFGPNSFEGFTRLSSLTLSHVSALTIKMALDQCPSIKKLKLEHLKKSTIGSLTRRSSYANVCALVLEYCEEPISKVLKVFPCLSKFKLSAVCRKQEIRKMTTDCLRRHLIEEDKKYGVVFESEAEIRFMVSVDLQASLSQAQKLLSECFQCELYVKGFKLTPPVSKQKVFYIY